MKQFFTVLIRSEHSIRYLGLLLLGMVWMNPYAEAQTISGVVFRDFNSNGQRPASVTGVAAGEVGVPGVVVTAYNSANSVVASTTTTSSGTYTFTTGVGVFRVEFTNLPTGDFDSFRGTDNGTNVQFVTVATSVTEVNLGINYPQNYCDSQNPPVVTTCFVSGTPTTTTPTTIAAGAQTVLVSVPFSGSQDAPHTGLGSALNLGAIWGIAYKRTTRQVFTAAFLKRHVGFGPGGAGAIYLENLTSTYTSSGTPTIFYNFSTVAGANLTLHGTLSTSIGQASTDAQSFSLVGKAGLGDIDISDDENYLYVTNLFNRRLYQINITTKDTISFAIPNNCSTGTSYRPFAVKYYRGKVYVGVVCTMEGSLTATSGSNPRPNSYGPTTGLQATVYEYTITPVTATSATATTAVALTFPFSYTKAATNADKTGQARAEYWRPWTNVFLADRYHSNNDDLNDNAVTLPQPWLTDIEFDVNGDMILGVRDRFGDQMGYQNYRPDNPANELFNGITPGEILRAGKCTSADSWTLESNGSTCTITATSGFQTTAQGPGTGKFYWGDRVQNGANHGLSSMGGLALLAGSGKTIMTAVDPTDLFNTGGLKRMINETGAKDGNAVYSTTNIAGGVVLYFSNDIATYGKANGVGDAELFCAAPPIQVGNRVWFDQNRDGVQDPNEPPIAGAVVQLYDAAKTTVLASVTTNANGEYYFSSTLTAGASTSSAATTALTYGTDYAIVISSLGTGTVVTANFLSLTSVSPRPGESSSINSGTTINNNDAVVENNQPCIRLLTNDVGGANHNFDFGLEAPCYLSVTATAGTCSSVTNQYTLNGIVSFTNTTASSVTVTVGTSSTVLSVSAATVSLPFTLTGLTSGLGTQTVVVTSSATLCATTSITYAVPASCTVPASVTANSATVCAGSPASLTATGCIGTIQWTGPNITSGATSSVVTVSTSASITTQTVVSYTATCVLYSSTAVSVGTVTVVPIPSLTLTASSLTVSQGNSVTLSVAGCIGGSLSGAITGNSLTAVVTAGAPTNVYSVSCTRSPGCVGSTSIIITTVPPLTLVVSSATVCAGQVASLSASGCVNGSITWNGPGLTAVSGAILPVPTSGVLTQLTLNSYTAICTTAFSSATAVGTVTVVPIPSLTLTASSLTVVQGSSVTLTVAGCASGQLTGAISSSSGTVIAMSPTTVYSVTCTSQPNCSGTASIIITALPATSLVVTSTTVCSGEIASLSAVGCLNGTVLFAGPIMGTISATAISVLTPANLTSTTVLSYTATCVTIADITTAMGTITVVPIPSLTLTASSLTVSQGNSVTLSVAGCIGGSLSGAITGNSLTAVVTAGAPTNVYSVSCTRSPGCVGSTSITITTVPPLTLVVSSATVCAGQVASLSASGCVNGSITWNGPGLTAVSGAILPVPTSGVLTQLTLNSYTAICTTAFSSATAVGTVTVVPIPSLTLTASSLTVTQGASVVLTVSGCDNGSIVWSDAGASGAVSTVTPGVGSTVYSVTCINAPSCSSVATIIISTVPALTLTVTSATVCVGNIASLSINGCVNGNVLWNGPGVTAVAGTILPIPTSATLTVTTTTTFTAICTTAFSSATAVGTVTAVPIPSLTLTASSLTVTQGASVVLTVSGCDIGNIVWSDAGASGAVNTVTPGLGDTVYSVTCTNTPSCSSVATITVSAIQALTLTVTSSTVCAGDVATLTASGCVNGSVLWNGPNVTAVAGAILPIPTSATLTTTTTLSYVATCTTPFSITSAVGTVTVVPIPSLTLTASSLTVVQGSSVTLTVVGCASGQLTGAISSSSSVVMIMNPTSVYSVTCTNQPNCSGSTSLTITGIPPTSLVVTNTTVCAGQPASLTVTGCVNGIVSFADPGSPTVVGSVLTVTTAASISAITTLSYTATCTTNLETTTAVGTVTVIPTPTVSLTGVKSSSGFSATLIANGCVGGTLLWSTSATTPSIIVMAGNTSTFYSVTCTVGPSCTATARLRIGLVPPVLDVVASGVNICVGQSVTLTATGCGADVVLWSTGASTASIVVSPTITTGYAVTCSDDISSVVGSATVTVAAVPALTLTASSLTITPGQAVTITATGCLGGAVVWSTGSTANGLMSVVDSPTANVTYSATCTTGPLCQTVATVTIIVPPLPLLSIDKLVSTSRAQLGDLISYTVVLTNSGSGVATNVVVRDSVSAGLLVLPASVTTSLGTYTTGVGASLWTITSLPGNTTATLVFSASVITEGIVYNTATIPGDTASVCTSIPIRVCRGSDYGFEISAPTGYTRYQWFRRANANAVETIVYDGPLSSFTATQPGEYRVVVDDVPSRCPDLSCCPVIIEEDSIPLFSVMARTPTCIANQAQANGSLTLMGLGLNPAQYTYQYSVGATFNPATAIPPAAIVVPVDGVIVSNLSATQTYTVRVFNSRGCFRDVTVVLDVNCDCPTEICVPVVLKKTKSRVQLP